MVVFIMLWVREEFFVVVEVFVCFVFLVRFGFVVVDGEDLEEVGGDREGSIDLDGGEKVGVDVCIGVVFVVNGFDGVDDDWCGNGGEGGGCDDEDGGNIGLELDEVGYDVGVVNS